jgi:GT2 family glycosyltransferase
MSAPTTDHPPPTAAPPHVAIIIINYRGRKDTLECLESLQGLTYPAYTVYVVDQDSKDGTVEAVASSYPAVRVLVNPVNNGFAGGNNVGIRQAIADGTHYLFLLNNDTTVAPDLLERLVERAESDPKIAVVGPLMLYYKEPEIVWSAGGRMSENGTSEMLADGERLETVPVESQDVDFIVGCGLLVKRTVLEQVGLMDERYFLYYEETDLCARIRRAGWRIVTEPQARLWHKISGTTGKESELTLYYMRRNVLLYLREHARHPARRVLWGVLDSLYLSSVWLLRGQYRRRRVLLRAVGDFLRGRFGKTDFRFQ